jgi:predicted nucleic acid-binding protein
MEQYVLDACALIAYFKQEPGFEAMIRFFDRADDGEISLSMHRLNLLEVFYGFFRDDGGEKAEAVLQDAANRGSTLPITVVDDLGEPLFHEAGRLKASYDVSFADSIALALASVRNAPLVTADHHDFDAVERAETVKLSWLR